MGQLKASPFRILASAANGKSQFATIRDANLDKNIGYKEIKKLVNYGILSSKDKKNSIELSNVTVFHRDLGKIITDAIGEEDKFFQNLGKGNVTKEYVPIVLSALIKPAIDIIMNGKPLMEMQRLEELSDNIKATLLAIERSDRHDKEVERVMTYFEKFKGKNLLSPQKK